MARESKTGLNVSQHYGVRETGRGAGQYPTSGVTRELGVELTGELLSDLIFDPLTVPAGAVVTKVALKVDEAFVLTGTASVEVGTAGTEATNGVPITKAQLAAVGYVDLTSALTGTWDAEKALVADTDLGIAMSAGAVGDKQKGRAILVIEYFKVV